MRNDAPAGEEPFMHVPPAYAPAPARLRAWIVAHPFAQVVTSGPAGPLATATPLVFETDDPGETRLVGHIARRNPQAATLAGPALAIFSGPDAYVSPRSYLGKPDLPTWNYVAVQARGPLTPLDDVADARAVLARAIHVMERRRRDPWSMAEADPARVAALSPHIRAFRLRIERVEGAMKLSQTKPPGERTNVIAALAADGAAEVAALMREEA